MAHTALRTAVAWLALSGLAAIARAQPADANAEPSAARERVLFLLPPEDPDTQSELREALLAQFALVEAELEFEPERRSRGSLDERIGDAQQRAEARGAVAVFWIDEASDERWFVHMMDGAGERIVVRPLDASGDRRAAAIEAVAVMTRESTRALLEGVPLERALPEPAPPPEATAPQPAPAPAKVQVRKQAAQVAQGVRLALGYAGSEIARQIPFRHGLQLWVGWMGFEPLYFGGSVAWSPEVQVQTVAEFELQPLTLSAHAGHRQRFGALLLDLELGLAIELLHSGPAVATPDGQVRPREAGTKATWALAPRLRTELQPIPALGVFATLGADLLVSNFRYTAKVVGAREPMTLLRGRDLRPVVTLGLAFYP